MEDTYQVMDYHDWVERYRPILENGRQKDYDPRVCDDMTYDKLDELIKSRKVWTLVETDSESFDSLVVLNGFHRVNRLEHYVCQLSYEADQQIEVT